MKAIFELNDNYKEIQYIDFNKKKYLISFNILIIIFTFLFFYTLRISMCPLFSIKSIIVLVILLYVFMLLHELIHGFFIKVFSKKKAIYNFTFFYASAGAKDRYFDKSSYIIIALAPVIILSIILLLILNNVSVEYYNAMLLLFALNFSGAIGDLYISLITLLKPKDTFILDEGESMHFYTKTP